MSDAKTTKVAPPSDIKFHQKSQTLEVCFDNKTFTLPAEYLRVYSPSAEVRGHGGGPLKLVTGKKQIRIINLKPVGHYALQITYDDGHDSGLYTWATLYELGSQQQQLWQSYLDRLEQEGGRRDNTPGEDLKPAVNFKKVT
ncbi:MAG: DUF971 domain-containing protein [Gammaproteobacteria bacterium]|nr:DUF971 domain-containing protein [Gammaproteobacteria bacterium]